MSLKKVFFQVVCLLALVLLTGCKKEAESPVSGHAAYYWSTVFKLSDVQRSFIRDHTTTVFIMNECMQKEATGLAHKIAARVLQMNETHDIANVKEIQIDCDWTQRTEKHFFAFLQTLREELRIKGIALSSTIRLHQLSQKAPPTDRGILMMYNTGDFTDLHCEKPILDVQAVGPYLKDLASYPLPLSAAYPIFSWRILFRGEKFIGIVHSEDEYPVLSSDMVVTRDVSLSEIMKARDMLRKRREDIHHEVILYELNEQNIKKYTHNDYEKILAD